MVELTSLACIAHTTDDILELAKSADSLINRVDNVATISEVLLHHKMLIANIQRDVVLWMQHQLPKTLKAPLGTLVPRH